MEVFITVLIFIVAAGYLLRKVFPFLLTWWIKRKMERFGNGTASYGTSGYSAEDEDFIRESSRNEGKVTVSGTSATEQSKIVDKEIGDYIEYEEEKSNGQF